MILQVYELPYQCICQRLIYNHGIFYGIKFGS